MRNINRSAWWAQPVTLTAGTHQILRLLKLLSGYGYNVSTAADSRLRRVKNWIKTYPTRDCDSWGTRDHLLRLKPPRHGCVSQDERRKRRLGIQQKLRRPRKRECRNVTFGPVCWQRWHVHRRAEHCGKRSSKYILAKLFATHMLSQDTRVITGLATDYE